MVTVNGLTAAAMEAIRDGAIVDIEIVSGDLIVTYFDTTTENLGPTGEVTTAALTAALAAYSPLPSSASYTPTLTNMAVGTGGSAENTARYTFVGGSTVGSKGPMTLQGRIRFGTTGVTLPGTGVPKIGLPAGFELADFSSTDQTTGSWVHGDIGTWYTRHDLRTDSATAMSLVVLECNTTLLRITIEAVSATKPATWVNGDFIAWTAFMIAERV